MTEISSGNSKYSWAICLMHSSMALRSTLASSCLHAALIVVTICEFLSMMSVLKAFREVTFSRLA